MLLPSSVRLSRALPAVAAGLVSLGIAANVRADDATSVTVHEHDPVTGADAKAPGLRVDYLSVGPILSLVGGYHHATGIGFEASWMGYPTGKIPSFGIGAFFQGQLYDGQYVRTAAGAQASAGPVGVEVGLGFRQADGTYASTVSTHTSVFLSIAYFYMAFRASAQLFALPTDEPSFGLETAFTVGLKLPITINGRDPTGYAIQAAGHAW
jgi:hypothetical protein